MKIRSMTGYGQAARSSEEADLTVEIKTLNSRYLDLNFHLPKELGFIESSLRKEIQEHLGRGRIDVYTNLTLKTVDQYEVNESRVQNYLAVGEKLQSLGVQGSVDLAGFLAFPGILLSRKTDLSVGTLMHTITEVFREALAQVVEARCAEGKALGEDLQCRIGTVSQLTDAISESAQEVTSRYREKLIRRISDLSQKQPVDEGRLSQEIVYYADRADISEEITRLSGHLVNFGKLLKSSKGAPVGRRLDFICQELNREMNTILSKSPLPEISELAVEGKTELEKVREQIQNVE